MFTYPLEPVDIKSFGSLVFINLVMLVENFNTSLGSLLDFLNPGKPIQLSLHTVHNPRYGSILIDRSITWFGHLPHGIRHHDDHDWYYIACGYCSKQCHCID